MRTFFFITLASCLLAAPSVLAQATSAPSKSPSKVIVPSDVRSHTQKLFLQAHLNGTGLSVDGNDAENGSGFGLKVGYGFSPLFTLYAGLDAASMNGAGGVDYGYGLFDIGGQFNFRSGANALVPYLDVALTGQAAVFEDSGTVFGEPGAEITFSGAGLTFGGGLKYFVSPVLALDGSLTATVGSFTTVEYDGVSVSDDEGIDANGARFSFGISWYPVR